MMTDKTLLIEAEKDKNILTESRRWLHAHAETGFDLQETKEYVRQKLIEIGCEPVDCGKAGLVAVIGGKKTGKTFLLRADMDALPIPEESDVGFPSSNGNMHACGHDMHTTMLLGAAKLLKAHEDEIAGTVKLMFQPAEEVFMGCQDMIQAGVLKNPDVDAAMMIHVTAGTPLPAGTVVVSAPGISAPAADYFSIRVQGQGCHGSAPEDGIDPLTASAHILIALQEIQARELAASDEVVLTIGTMNAGTAANAIPDSVAMGGSIRTFDEKVRAKLKRRLIEIATGVASAFRTAAEVSFGSGCPTLVNDELLSTEMRTYLTDLLGEKMVLSTADFAVNGKASRGGGSEDFAYATHQVPSLMLALAAGEPGKGYQYPQHHPKVKFDETVLPVGSAVFAYAAMRWLDEHQIKQEV